MPSVLRDVSDVDLTTQVLGKPAAVPFAFAPTGFTRMMHHEGESAVASVAARRRIPYALSTMGTTSIEDVAQVARGAATDLVARAAKAGYKALILTVDVPVAGARLRDTRNGFSIPAALSLRTIADMALHPTWWANLLTTEPCSSPP